MKILAFNRPGTNSRSFFLDILQGIEELGHEVMQFELEPYIAVLEAMGEHVERAIEPLGNLVLEFIKANDIDLSLSMWSTATLALPQYRQSDGSTVSFLDHHEQPHLHYWWDAPHWYHGGKEIKNIANGIYRGAHQFHYINNPGTGSEMASLMGFGNVIPSPNGVNPQLFRPHPEIPKEYDLVFVSGPGDPEPTEIMLQELERDDPDVDRIRKDVAQSLRPELDALAEQFDEPVREPIRRLFDAMVEARLANRHSPALVHLQQALQSGASLSVAADALIKNLALYVKATDTIRRIEKWERPFIVAYLSRHFNCLRLGQQSYDAWGIEGDASGFVDYQKQPEVYAKGRAALNVMRWQDDIGVNSKVFEITACGTACLQAYRGGIDELFCEGSEILVYKTPGEARQQLAEALSTPGRLDELAQAGRARTLRDHTWAKRMELVLGVVSQYWAQRGRVVEQPIRIRTDSNRVSPTGDRLAFILAPMRSGSTLLRKMLDGHPRLASPPETWFLLPLLDLWNGQGESPQFNVRQAAVALQTVTDRATFVAGCRAFASQIYSPLLPADGAYVIDKTPMYLKIAGQLPEMFPEAKFIVLVRDPRSIVWSAHTWKHTAGKPLEQFIPGIAKNVRTQYEFVQNYHERCEIVHYEQLCSDPLRSCKQLCDFLGTSFDTAMIEYGSHGDEREGYGDEKSQAHDRPHTDSLRRWEGDGSHEPMTVQQQRTLAEKCSAEALRFFGYDELAELLTATLAGSTE